MTKPRETKPRGTKPRVAFFTILSIGDIQEFNVKYME
jgi:hypothetical protein